MIKEQKSNIQDKLKSSISLGVTHDYVNLRTVAFWMILGIVMVTIILIGLYNLYNYNQFLSTQQAAINAEYHELEQLRERDRQKLTSFEMIDEENRRFRIPIDSAMTLIASDR